MERKIYGIGETVLDIVFRDGEPQAAVPGGSTFNAMISLGRTAGATNDIYMLTQTGDDAVADIVSEFMSRNGVKADYVQRMPGNQSTVSLAMLDSNSDAHYEFFRDMKTPPFTAADINFSSSDLLVFGSFFAINSETAAATRQIVEAASSAGATIYYDVNFRKNHLKSLDEVKPLILQNCSLSTVVRASGEDILNVFATDSATEVYEKYLADLCPVFICTKGARATEVFSPCGRAVFPVPQINTVSTIGAGDNFNAGFIYALLSEGFNAQRVSALTREDWAELVPVATAFSSAVCQSMYNYVPEGFTV